ncbi:MAG: hypothetical protein KBA40_01750 [Candidatus Peribacteraceae bacterium]|nr:hypothetical protein [Candidatus Peribacteraceae bacterium]MBP9850848.1 hypothetical protein [Candidatus Peribacteraceae bacterium]
MEIVYLQDVLDDLTLEELTLKKPDLFRDMFNDETNLQLLFAFVTSLEGDEWTGSELLASFESSEFFVAETSGLTLLERITKAEIIRHFLRECLVVEMQKKCDRLLLRESAKTIEENIRGRVLRLIDEQLEELLDEEGRKTPERSLKSCSIFLPRLKARINEKMRKRINDRKQSLADIQRTTLLGATSEESKRVQSAEEDSRILTEIMQEWPPESHTAESCMEEMSTTLHRIHPGHAYRLTEYCAAGIGEMIAENKAAAEPGYAGHGEPREKYFLLRGLQYRFTHALRRVAGLDDDEEL